MPIFSERFGYSQVRDTIQIDGINDELKNGLWSAFYNTYFLPVGELNKNIDDNNSDFFYIVWNDFLKRRTDEIPGWWSIFKHSLKDFFFKCEWWRVYDFLEFIVSNDPNSKRSQNLIIRCNFVLEKELAGFRFLNNLITPITSESELAEIEEALITPSQVNIHLKQALVHLSNKESPDYRNSVKESISAVEALCKIISNNPKATLSSAINEMEMKQIIKFHPDLRDALKKIYSWTNDDEGIRHALKEDPSLDVEDAKYMLIVCSAFINYIKVKASKSGIALNGA